VVRASWSASHIFVQKKHTMLSPPPYESASTGPYRPAPPPPPLPPRVSPLAAFKFVLDSEAPLTTVLLATGLLLIPFIGQIAFLGYQAEVFQRLVRREENAMPKLATTDILPLLSRGISAFVVEYIVMSATMFPAFMVIGALTFLAGNGGPPSRQGLWLIAIAIAGTMACVFALVMPVWNAAVTRVALTEDLAGSLKPKAVLSYARRTWTTVLFAYFVFSLLSTALGIAGMLACFVGCYPAIVLAQLASVHLRWQIYESQLARGGTLIPVKLRAALPAPMPAVAYGSPSARANVPSTNRPEY